MQLEKIYTVKEICELFRITRQTLYRQQRRGLIKSFRIGKNIRFTEEEVSRIKSGVENGN